MSRTLARIKLREAQSALQCLKSNVESAAGQLSGDDELGVYAEGLRLFESGLNEMQGAIRSIIGELEESRPALMAAPGENDA